MNASPTLRRRVLVIDDDRAVLEDYRRVLAAPGPRPTGTLAASFFGRPTAPAEPHLDVMLDCVQQGADGVAAVAAAIAAGDPYHVVFVDMRMPPGIDGSETMRQIREVDPSLPCIVCTAFSDVGSDKLRGEFGAQLVVLHKPFEPKEIRNLVRSSVERRAA